MDVVIVVSCDHTFALYAIILSPMRSLESAECVKGTCQVEAVVSLVPKKFTENVEHKENTNLLQTFIEVFLNYIDQ